MPNHWLHALVCGVFVVNSAALADSISTVGQVTVLDSPPASVAHGALTSDQTAYVFFEGETVLSAPLQVDISEPGVYTTVAGLTPAEIPAGTAVDSYFFTDEPVTVPASGERTYLAGITFSTEILGVIVETPDLDDSDAELGAPGTSYPPPTDLYSGLELNTPGCSGSTCGDDAVRVTANDETIDIRSLVRESAEDQVRILTLAVPEPGTVVLGSLGLLFYAIVRRLSGRGSGSARMIKPSRRNDEAPELLTTGRGLPVGVGELPGGHHFISQPEYGVRAGWGKRGRRCEYIGSEC